MDAVAAVRTDIRQSVEKALDAVASPANDFGGWDFEPESKSAREGMTESRPASYVRVVPVDHDFAYGTDIYVFSTNDVVLASVELRAGNASADLIAAVARDLWSVR